MTQPTPTELLALADEMERHAEHRTKVQGHEASNERLLIGWANTIRTTLSAREDGWQPNRVHDTEVSVYVMGANDFLIRVREDWYRGHSFKHLSPEDFIAACKARDAKAPAAGEGDALKAPGDGVVTSRQQKAAREGVCLWSQQDDGYDTYSTGCGHEFTVNDCTDGKVELPYCPFCAMELESRAWSADEDEQP